MRLTRIALLVFAAIAVSAYVAFRTWERSWYEGLLPSSLKIESIVALGMQDGFREGCGAVVFKLDPEVARTIRRTGLAALASARQARAESAPYFSYAEWGETPYRETGDGLTLKDRWLNGLVCANLEPELGKAVDGALRSGGSFFSRGAESGLIVLPTEGLAVLSFEG